MKKNSTQSTDHSKHVENRAPARAILAYALIIALSLAWSGCSAEEKVMYVFCKPDGEVNIREKPNIHSNISGRLLYGMEVTTSGWRTDSHGRVWAKVDDVTEMGYGWVSSEYLSETEPETLELPAWIQSNGRVAIRKVPGGERKAWANPGAICEVIVRTADWCLTDLGYIKTEYVRVLGEGNDPDTST